MSAPLASSNSRTSGHPAPQPGLLSKRPSSSYAATGPLFPHCQCSARRVAHTLAALGNNSYDHLRAFLLVANQLTTSQKAEKLFSSEPLGDCLPSELLSEMLELDHPGEERTRLFSMLFLRHLSAAVRLQLTKDDHEDVHILADKVDRCSASIHCQEQLVLESPTAVDDCEDEEEHSDYSITAVSSDKDGCFSQCSRGGQNCPKGGRGGQQP